MDAKLFAFCFSLCLCLVYSFTTGGWTNLDTQDKTVQALAIAAVAETDSRSNAMYKNKLVTLTKAEVQVVAGMQYRLTLDVAQSDCRKNDHSTLLEDCNMSDDNVQTCVITFWIQPWMKTQEVSEYDCKASTSTTTTTMSPGKGRSLGEGVDFDPDSQEVKDAANFALYQMNKESNKLRNFMLMDVRNVQRKTVAGVEWNMLLQVGLSACTKSLNRKNLLGKKMSDDCSAKVKPFLCSVTVLEQIWSNTRYQLTKHKCAPTSIDFPKTHPNTDSAIKKPILGRDYVGNPGEFENFKVKYNKTYVDRTEEKRRYLIFRDNMKYAQKIQAKEKGTAKYGATKFADIDRQDFKRLYTGSQWNVNVANTMTKAEIPTEAAPDAWDWRDHNAVTEVKNQGQCGSCWAFSTTGNIEGQWSLAKGQLLSLSEQELVDCDKVDQGCNGGLPADAYKAIEKLGGLETEKEYPYEGKGETCEFSKGQVKAYINSSVSVSTNEDDMKAWLYKNGPISIGINANAMQFYMGGVSHPFSILCNPDNLDHGVLIVGYGIAKGWFSPSPYWIVKNSWGPDWGEKGYYLVYRGSGVCGLNKMPTSAVVDK